MSQTTYRTRSGMTIHTRTEILAYQTDIINPLLSALDTQKGAVYTSNYEYPDRYDRWCIGFFNPPLELIANDRQFTLRALNARGEVLLHSIAPALEALDAVDGLEQDLRTLSGFIPISQAYFPEEKRSRQPSVFTVIRCIQDVFYSTEDEHLGLYGAFGYDLVFQFENFERTLKRDKLQRDLVLYLPDEIYIIDHKQETAKVRRYDFEHLKESTLGLTRNGISISFQEGRHLQSAEQATCDHQAGEYASNVSLAQESFKKGDLFEVVLSQTFSHPCDTPPSHVFQRLCQHNPSPYGFFINLGEDEYLVGASPEMYVRVTDKRVETAPISGTIVRGKNAIEDADQIRTLLNSKKDESELTMCTDVDRNDKSRICEAGSVKVIGRRQLELYSRLIHTVDHVEGILREGFDALDAFLTHMWVVTITGAPKPWAMRFIEAHEKSARSWYGGAIGWLNFNGNLNTGLTLRTIQVKEGIANVRAGATLLYDSNPEDEEKETRLKASALVDAVLGDVKHKHMANTQSRKRGLGKKILIVDHQDSFLHTLANYFRQTGADVVTVRYDYFEAQLDLIKPDLVVLSPGPGTPDSFHLNRTIQCALDAHIPLFGVCLGLQGIVEYFGGALGILDYPMHGKPTQITVEAGQFLKECPSTFTAGLYHSLYAISESMPKALVVSARSEAGVVMAIEHKTLPISAVQFHPESILSIKEDVGMNIIEQVVACL